MASWFLDCLRLLVRVTLVVVNISTDSDTSAFFTLATAGTMLVIQLFVKPFRDPTLSGKTYIFKAHYLVGGSV